MSDKKLSQFELETTREVIIGGQKFRVRKIVPSSAAIKGLGARTKRVIVSHMPIEPRDLQKKFAMKRADILREMALMSAADREMFIDKGVIDFVTDKGEKVAYVWAANDKLDEWVDLHYICWYNKESWRGALSINVSPIDGRIGIECACGEDTRDFRTAKHIPPIRRTLMIEYSLKHRQFGSPESKFAAIAA